MKKRYLFFLIILFLSSCVEKGKDISLVESDRTQNQTSAYLNFQDVLIHKGTQLPNAKEKIEFQKARIQSEIANIRLIPQVDNKNVLGQIKKGTEITLEYKIPTEIRDWFFATTDSKNIIFKKEKPDKESKIGIWLSSKTIATEKNTDMVQDNTKQIEEVLLKQLGFGYDVYNHATTIQYYPFKESDMFATLDPIASILKKNGYRPVLNFKEKVISIFGKLKETKRIMYLNGFERCSKPKTITYYDQDGYRTDYYFDLKNNFITNLYFLPEIIDYKKDYPEIAKKEALMKDIKFKSEEDEYKNIYVQRWKDYTYLQEERKKNIELLINRNLYLFNDDKSKLPWLLQNDEDFIKMLVTEFGWTEDKKLVTYFLDKYLLKEISGSRKKLKYDFGSILWHKNCDNQLVMNQNALEAIESHITPNNNKYLEAMYIYIYILRGDGVQRIGNLSYEEISKILAHLLYFSEKNFKHKQGYDYDYRFLTEFTHFDFHHYEKEFEKNNYYNLTGFRQMLEQAKKEAQKVYSLIDDEIIERGEEELEFERIAKELGKADINPLDYPHKKYYGID